jgi:hypothetical protein
MPESIDQLKSALRGEPIGPTDAAYEAARKVYNGVIDKRPRLIARCVDVADVIAAVNFGVSNGMLTAVRGLSCPDLRISGQDFVQAVK